jgi:hypothetical protein
MLDVEADGGVLAVAEFIKRVDDKLVSTVDVVGEDLSRAAVDDVLAVAEFIKRIDDKLVSKVDEVGEVLSRAAVDAVSPSPGLSKG